jgi:hypothetical protein
MKRHELEMLRAGMLDQDIVVQRIGMLPISDTDLTLARERWHRLTLTAARNST